MAQFARPDTDLAAGAWTPSTGALLYALIDEASYDDADYIRMNNSPASTCQLRLSDISDPNTAADHIMRVRAYKAGTGAITCTAYLFQGASQICTFTVALGTSAATTTYTLTAGEANAITDYADLRLHLRGVCNAPSRFIYVTWAELEVPNAFVALNTGAMTLVGQAATVVKGTVTKTLNAAAMTLAGRAAAIDEGIPGTTIELDTA